MHPVANPDIGYGTNGGDQIETDQTRQHLPALQPSIAIGEAVVEIKIERNGRGNRGELTVEESRAQSKRRS